MCEFSRTFVNRRSGVDIFWLGFDIRVRHREKIVLKDRRSCVSVGRLNTSHAGAEIDNFIWALTLSLNTFQAGLRYGPGDGADV